MRELKVDRERAIKTVALAGLVILALSVLPGLLRTPEPPELPPDVGFRPVEGAIDPVLPGRLPEPLSDRHADNRRSKAAGNQGGRTGRARRGTRPAQSSRNSPRKRQKYPRNAPKKAKSASPSASVPLPPAPVGPAVSTPPPAPPPAPPPVTQRPSPAPSPSPTPNDGSQEFAPH